MQYQNQINAQNLISAQASYVTSNSIRDNNQFYAVGGEVAAPIVSAANPYGGLCYGGAAGALSPIACSTHAATAASGSGRSGLGRPLVCADCRSAELGGLLVRRRAVRIPARGERPARNVQQRRPAASSRHRCSTSGARAISWLINAGVRLDSFTFIGSNTDTGAARDFWTNAFNPDNCVNNVSGAPGVRPAWALATRPYRARRDSTQRTGKIYRQTLPTRSGSRA